MSQEPLSDREQLPAHITTAKFAGGLPLTRQSKQFERAGADPRPGHDGAVAQRDRW